MLMKFMYFIGVLLLNVRTLEHVAGAVQECRVPLGGRTCQLLWTLLSGGVPTREPVVHVADSRMVGWLFIANGGSFHFELTTSTRLPFSTSVQFRDRK